MILFLDRVIHFASTIVKKLLPKINEFLDKVLDEESLEQLDKFVNNVKRIAIRIQNTNQDKEIVKKVIDILLKPVRWLHTKIHERWIRLKRRFKRNDDPIDFDNIHPDDFAFE